ncbi:hypothetical protein MNBD_NITROSPINAE01-1110 [hydrothermal vent metagenome]|uniref:Porin domain-containing protein n=1 Tax=hydrothermal vent metagenome TaxID=652676 RepID=A0A3B1BQL0_9ZZZZ
MKFKKTVSRIFSATSSSALALALAIAPFALPANSEAASVVIEDVTFSGFVDTSYYSNELTDSNTFALDQVELDVEKTINSAGGLRMDIQYVNTGENLTTDDILEQGYIWVNLPADLKLTFGKFNAPIGFELLDPNDMYQYSHSMVFDYGLPTNLTGAMVSGGFGMFDFAVYAVNGWDLISDDNKDKTFGGRFGVTPVEGVNFGVSGITGEEGTDAGGAKTSNLSVVDIDFTITAIANLVIGGELNAGTYENMSAVTPGDDAKWTAFLVMANYSFTDKIALTLRYDQFHDEDGARLGNGIEETRSAITISPSYAIADGFGVLAEYRYTSSDEDTFVDRDGNKEGSASEVAVKFTFVF